MELNRQARALNRRVARRGGQGEGHEAVRPDRGYCLLPLERQDLALRDLCSAVESTSEAVCLTAMTSEAGRALLPSDFFLHAWQAGTGRAPDEEALAALARATAGWCEKQSSLGPAPEKETADISATQIAHAARRNREQPFGRYEFAYAEPPPQPIQLPCKTWETAWNHPAVVWLEEIIGVSAWPEGEPGWPRAVGDLGAPLARLGLGACRERGDAKDFLPLVRAAAERERQRTAERAGTALYPWWNHVWGQARAVALGLAQALEPQLRERFFLSEYRLPPARTVALPGAERADFELRGQIDLLLVEPVAGADPAAGNFSGCSCWVVDFKTGSAGNLTPKKIEKGTGLQAMLYALAVRASGAASVAASLQTFDTPLKPQIQIERIEANAALFRSLDRLHRAGIFGQRPDAENDYGFSPAYPLATRPIPAEVLEAKWALVHGAAALWEEA